MSDKLLYVRPEVYALIKSRAHENHRPMSSQIELDVRNQIQSESS